MTNQTDPDRFNIWQAWFVIREIANMAEAIDQAMPTARAELEEAHGPLPMLQPARIIAPNCESREVRPGRINCPHRLVVHFHPAALRNGSAKARETVV